jgi:hypothetical protein
LRAIPAAVLSIGVLAFGSALAACDGGPLLAPQIVSDTVTISVPDTPTGLASALDLVRVAPPFTIRRRPELSADAEQWDFALRSVDGGLALRPITPLSGFRGAGIAVSAVPFDQLTTAPRGVPPYRFETTALVQGATYVARSRQYGGACVKYAKIEVVTLDVAAGTAHLRMAINENCEDERLTA